MADVCIGAEVTAQANDITLYSGKSELFVKIKLPRKCPRHLIMVRVDIMSLEHTTKKMASVSGPFIKWSS